MRVQDTKLYHADVYMPADFARPCYQGPLTYGHHAQGEASSDRYGEISLPGSFKVGEKSKLIEAEVANNRVIKQVWRQPLDDTRDIVLVITNDGFVKTVWVNLASDKHTTLNKARYVQGKKR